MDKDYYRIYFDYERRYWWFRARSEILSGYIARHLSKPSATIANIGVATGASTYILQQFGSVSSLEYEQSCIDFIKDKVDFEIIQGSILDLPYPDKSFDLACAFDVVEHVDDDHTAVRELARICKPGGSILITVPAHMYLWSDHDRINHHFRRYNKKGVEQLFSALPGGKIVYCSYFNTLLFPLILLARKLGNLTAKKDGKIQSDLNRFNTGPFDGLLYRIMKSEGRGIANQRNFLNGVSLLLHWRKD